jgi:hypothetical protein
MLLLRSQETARQPDTWTARAAFRARADEVLDALTDPALIELWAPIGFDVDGLRGGRLVAGSHALVSGSIAGVSATFEVDVARADSRGLELTARGPVSFDVFYTFRSDGDAVVVDACVSLARQRGITAQVLRTVAAGMLSAGALGCALSRLENVLDEPVEAGVLVAC